MSALIIQEKTPLVSRFPRRGSRQPDNTDPHHSWRRLAAAVVLQAVKDTYFPDQCTTQYDSADARQWLESQVGDDMLREFLGVAHAA